MHLLEVMRMVGKNYHYASVRGHEDGFTAESTSAVGRPKLWRVNSREKKMGVR